MAQQLDTRRGPISREEAADRVSAYVYGNILMLAAMTSIHVAEADQWPSLLRLVNAGLATYIAHVFADLCGLRVKHEEHITWHQVWHEFLIARPVLTSALVPGIPIAAACLGWIDGTVAMVIGLVGLAGRLAWIGMEMSKEYKKKPSWRVMMAGLGFAALALGIAAAKVYLSH